LTKFIVKLTAFRIAAVQAGHAAIHKNGGLNHAFTAQLSAFGKLRLSFGRCGLSGFKLLSFFGN
jgi:hypothetical protein